MQSDTKSETPRISAIVDKPIDMNILNNFCRLRDEAFKLERENNELRKEVESLKFAFDVVQPTKACDQLRGKVEQLQSQLNTARKALEIVTRHDASIRIFATCEMDQIKQALSQLSKQEEKLSHESERCNHCMGTMDVCDCPRTLAVSSFAIQDDIEVGVTITGKLYIGMTGRSWMHLDRAWAQRLHDRIGEVLQQLPKPQ